MLRKGKVRTKIKYFSKYICFHSDSSLRKPNYKQTEYIYIGLNFYD